MTIIINEQQLKLLIKEELGINQSIHEVAVRILNAIIEDIPNRGKEENKSNFFTTQRGYVIANLDGHEFKIKYCYRNIFNRENVDEYGEENLVTGHSTYLGRYRVICNINLYGINGHLIKNKALEVIQHELEDIYQEFRANKTIPNNMLYAKMRTDMESNDIKRRQIGRLIYGCLKSEQEGFVNGLYSYCMVDGFDTPPYTYDIINSSEAGKLYSEISGILTELKTDKELQDILKEYKWSVRKVDKCVQMFLKRIARVMVKVNNDKIKKGWR